MNTVARLIDADTPIKNICHDCPYKCNEFCRVVKHIINAPTIDAVPVIRCKDCKHRDPEDKKCDCGSLARQGCPFPVDDNYFCGYGERKDGDSNG